MYAHLEVLEPPELLVQPQSATSLLSLTLEQIEPLITESAQAFIAPVEDPLRTAADILDHCRLDPFFELFGYTDSSNQAITYICVRSHPDGISRQLGPMYVSAAYQGYGLGKGQVIDVMQILRQRGIYSVAAQTWSSNESSKHIFRSLGFTQIGRVAHDRTNGDDTILFHAGI